MGLLDSMFGGGTDIALTLDRPQGSPGGVVGGTVRLTGGKKPLKLTTLRVHLIYVSVKTNPDSAIPDIDTRVVGEQTIAAGLDLPPGSVHEHSFRITVPHDTLPTAHNVSYKVQAVADIPQVKDPTADQDLKVVPADKNQHYAMPVAEILAKFPGLQSQDEDQLCEALREVFLECYSAGAMLMEIEPLLAQYMQSGTVRVRKQALQAWANLVDNRVKPQHLQSLYGIANTPGLDKGTFDEVIKAACKFAEEGAFQMVQQLAQSADPHVRCTVANGLQFDAAKKFQGKRELLIGMINDADPKVRAAVISAFWDFNDDAQIVHGVAQQCDKETSPAVQVSCIRALSFAHHHGFEDVIKATYEKHLQNPSTDVRRAIAENLSSQPKDQAQWVWNMAKALLADPDEAVRAAMAFQFVNMKQFPQLLPLAHHAAENDPAEKVRDDAMQGMGRLGPASDVVPYYQQKLANNPPRGTLFSIIGGLRYQKKEAAAQTLLSQLGQHPDPDVANAARDALTY